MPFLEDIVSGYVTAGVGVFGTNIFLTSRHNTPDGDGPYLSIVETPGREADETHNEVVVPAYQRPSAQVVVCARTYQTARTMARAAYNASRVTNQLVNGTWYRRMRPSQEPFDYGLDPKGRPQLAFNLTAEKGPS